MAREPSISPQPASGTGGYRPGYEIAAERILEYIVKERLTPGTRLPTEKDLADAVGMSRTVVREAVKILSAVGHLSVQKGRGIYVADPEGTHWQESFSRFLPADLRQVDEMFEFRRHIETAVALDERLAEVGQDTVADGQLPGLLGLVPGTPGCAGHCSP